MTKALSGVSCRDFHQQRTINLRSVTSGGVPCDKYEAVKHRVW